MEQQSGYKLGKHYVRVILCHPAYFGIFQSSLLVFLGWFDPKGFPGGSAGKEPACNVRDLG